MTRALLTKVVLLGPRGVGKSTLGRALAARLGWGFLDTDDALAAQVGMPAGDFLASRGEAAFRAEERVVVLRALARRGRLVVALGGGAVTIPEVRMALARPSILPVLLQAPTAVLVDRQAAHPRPPLTDRPLRQEVEHLLERRRDDYQQVARITLETFPANVDACCERLLATIVPQPRP